MDAKTIVLLDRDADVCTTLRAMLECEGHAVFAATTPAGLLTELSKRQVDAVLTNCVAGSFEDEAPLLATVRAMQPLAAIVLTTRWTGPLDNPLPFDSILPKPFSILDVREVLAAVIRRRRRG